MIIDQTARRCAAAAAGCGAAGTAAVAYAVTAAPGLGLRTYISEAGVPTYPHAVAFRAGILLLAAGLALLGLALRRRGGVPATLLLAAAAFATGAGAVPCSDGCPLPPYEISTAADLVHAGASILAVAASVFAMAALSLPGAFPGPDRLLRTLALSAAAAAFPLSAAVGLAMLSVGRGAAIGVLERTLLAVIAAWLLATATRLALTGGAPPTRTRRCR